MITTITPLRRVAVTLVLTGATAFGAVAVAPAAFAAPAQDGPNYVIEGNGSGPDAFVVTSTGRIPVFFCEDVQPGKNGVVDPKDIERAAKKAADEARKAARDADRDARKAAEAADRAARDADRAAWEADKPVRDAARKAADEAERAARDAEKAAQEAVDRVIKQHNICLALTPGGPRF